MEVRWRAQRQCPGGCCSGPLDMQARGVGPGTSIVWRWNVMGSLFSWNRPGIPTPDRDDFYDSPTGLDEVAHGTVLRSRPVQLSFFGRFRHGAAVQLMYRSTAAHGRPEAAVTTVVVPRGKDPANCPVLS